MSGRARIARGLQEGSLYGLLFLLPFSKAAVEIAFGVLLLGWGLERVNPETRRESAWCSASLRLVAGAIVTFLTVCALSVMTSDYPALSARGFVRKWLEYLLFFVIVTDVARRPRVLGRCLAILALSSLCVAGMALAQEVAYRLTFEALDGTFPRRPLMIEWVQGQLAQSTFRVHPAFTYRRMTGPYENPGDLATYLMVLIPVVLARAISGHRARRWPWWFLAVVLIGCLIRTGAQGASLGFLVGLLFMSGLRYHRSGIAAALGVTAIGAGLLSLGMTGRLSGTLGQRLDAGGRDRLVMWQAAWDMIEDRPILGHGLNTFMANYLRFRVGGESQPRYAHNCFLQVAAETGILGLVAFLWLLGTSLRLWWMALARLGGSPAARAAVLGLSGGLVAFLVQSSMDTNFYSLRQATLFWVLAGLATGVSITVLPSAPGARRTT